MLQSSHFSSWKHAPVSKSIFSICGVTTFFSFLIKYPLSLELPIQRSGLWNLFSSPFYFPNVNKAFFSLSLLYIFRVIERKMGSRKFAMFGLLSLTFSMSMEYLWFIVVSSQTPTSISGLNGLLFACLYHFFAFIPSIVQENGSFFSDKSRVYLLGGTLLFTSENYRSAIFGTIFSIIYSSSTTLRELQFPEFLVRAANRFILPLLESPSTQNPNSRYRFRNVAGGGVGAGGLGTARNPNRVAPRANDNSQQGYTDQLIGGEDFGWGFPARFGGPQRNPQPAAVRNGPDVGAVLQTQNQAAPQPQPPIVLRDEDINSLMSLGFEHSSVVTALQQANNDLSRASNILLDGNVH